MSITAAAALLSLLAALFLAMMLAAEKEHNAATRSAARRAGADGQADTRRTRHLSPHRAAIERLKGKEAARGRR